MTYWKVGDLLKYRGTYTGTLRIGLCKVFDSANQDNVGVEDETGTTWWVPGIDLISPPEPEKKKSRTEELVTLKQGGFSVDDILRLNESGLL